MYSGTNGEHLVMTTRCHNRVSNTFVYPQVEHVYSSITFLCRLQDGYGRIEYFMHRGISEFIMSPGYIYFDCDAHSGNILTCDSYNHWWCYRWPAEQVYALLVILINTVLLASNSVFCWIKRARQQMHCQLTTHWQRQTKYRHGRKNFPAFLVLSTEYTNILYV